MIISEKRLIGASIAISVVGIALLFLMAAFMEPPHVEISQLEASGKVKISGFVLSMEDKGAYYVLKLGGTETVDAVSFDAGSVEKLGLERLQEVEVIGEVRQFRGESSIVISSINPLSRINCSGGWDG